MSFQILPKGGGRKVEFSSQNAKSLGQSTNNTHLCARAGALNWQPVCLSARRHAAGHGRRGGCGKRRTHRKGDAGRRHLSSFFSTASPEFTALSSTAAALPMGKPSSFPPLPGCQMSFPIAKANWWGGGGLNTGRLTKPVLDCFREVGGLWLQAWLSSWSIMKWLNCFEENQSSRIPLHTHFFLLLCPPFSLSRSRLGSSPHLNFWKWYQTSPQGSSVC